MSALDLCASYEDFRTLAQKRLPHLLFDYIDGGSYSETTLARNEADFRNLTLDQRVMIDVSNVDSQVTLFGDSYAMPVIMAPVGFAGMFARRGEIQAGRAAVEARIPYSLSTVGICSLEEATLGVGTPPWFQLYMIKDRDWMAKLLERASAAGSKVLFLTGDLQTPGTRYRDIRNGMTQVQGVVASLKRVISALTKLDWTWDVGIHGKPHTFGNLAGVLPPAASYSDAWGWINENFDPSINWADLDFIREHWKGPIVLKGIMTEEDARIAVDHGVDGIVISNHGGRQLDGAPSTISVLPKIAEAVDGRLTVLMDGGVRNGLDVLKAVQYGADACMIGRPWAFALAAGGYEGVARMLGFMGNELKTAQILSGTTRLQK